MLSVLAGCVDDKTIDEFKVLNQVTIEGLQERYSVLLYNRLQCTPVIRTSQNDESNLSYVWYAYTTTTRNEADTLVGKGSWMYWQNRPFSPLGKPIPWR